MTSKNFFEDSKAHESYITKLYCTLHNFTNGSKFIWLFDCFFTFKSHRAFQNSWNLKTIQKAFKVSPKLKNFPAIPKVHHSSSIEMLISILSPNFQTLPTKWIVRAVMWKKNNFSLLLKMWHRNYQDSCEVNERDELDEDKKWSKFCLL